MRLEEILDSWKSDSKIDATNLDNESLRISELHHTYLRLLSLERVKLKQAKNMLKSLESTLYQYFNGDFNTDQTKLDELKRDPWQQRILRQNIKEYVDSDQQIVDIRNKISIMEEKVEVLTEVMKSLQNRSYQISNAINFKELLGGN